MMVRGESNVQQRTYYMRVINNMLLLMMMMTMMMLLIHLYSYNAPSQTAGVWSVGKCLIDMITSRLVPHGAEFRINQNTRDKLSHYRPQVI